MPYNYIEAMKKDILEAIEDCNDYKRYPAESREDYAERLEDDMWACDSVTGNECGSYTRNAAKAMDYVHDNHALLAESVREFCCPTQEVVDHFLNGDWEWFDVTIRCYLLSQAISEVIDELEAKAS